MAKIKSTLTNVGKMPEATGTVAISSAARLRPNGANAMTTDGTVYEKIENGVFLSRDLVAGHARVEFVFKTRRMGPFDVNIPTGSVEYDVWDLIAQYLPAPPLVISQAATYAAEAKAARDQAVAAAGSGGGGSTPQIVADPNRQGFFVIPSGSSITESQSRPGVFVIGA